MTKRRNGLLALATTVLLGLSLAAQQGQGQNPPQDPATGGQKPSPSPPPSAKTALDIALTTQPDPPKTGENTFDVTVKDADGKPVTDAAPSP